MASEFRYRDPVLDCGTLVVAISQSGETADTLEAVRHAKAQKAKVLAICNTNGSQIPRESDAVLPPGPGDRRRRHQDVPWPRRRQLSRRAGAGPGPRHRYLDEVQREYRELEAMPDRGAGSRAGWRRSTELGRTVSPSRRRCCSPAATSATRWR